MATPRTTAAPVPAACALGPGLRAYLTAGALDVLGEGRRAVLPVLWSLIEAHGHAGMTPTEHDIGEHHIIRVVAGADGALVIGLVGVDFPAQAA
jgi:hypothetical protein